MEQNKIRIFTNHPDRLKETINKFNSLYETDFEFLEFFKDEVNYAYVYYTKSTISDVFEFGRQFGNIITHLKNKGEIKD